MEVSPVHRASPDSMTPPRRTGGFRRDLDHARDELRDACGQLESFLWHDVLTSMRSTLADREGGFLQGGPGEELFDSLLDQEWAERLTARGGFGLARSLYDQLSRHLTREEP